MAKSRNPLIDPMDLLRRKKIPFRGNPDHLAILNQALDAHSPRPWNHWREQHPRVIPDLRGVYLSGRALRGINLRRAKLDGAILTRADLAGVHMEDAGLRDARLMFANLINLHANGADFSGALLRDAT